MMPKLCADLSPKHADLRLVLIATASHLGLQLHFALFAANFITNRSIIDK